MMENEPIEYTITFDGNGADDGEMDEIEATYDEEYTLTANTFTRAGYKFTGWNTEADGSGTSYEDEATVSNLTTEDGDTITLYAQWKEYTITVTEYTEDTIEAEYDYEDGAIILYFIDGFDTAEYAQLGAYEVSTSTSSTTYFIDYANTYASIHEGYTMNATYEVFGYIQFSEVETMSISLYSQLDYWGLADEESALGVAATEVSPIIYVYLADGVEYAICGDQSGDYIMDWAVLALVLEYEPINYSISFDGNGADDGEMDAISATYDEEYTLTANTFTRAGYKFTGWNTEADGSGTSYEDGETVSNLTTEDGGTITLYAQWKPITYTIAFDGNGADDGEMDSITATYDEEYTLTANTFTRDGYTFTGWNTEADGSGTSYEDGTTVSNLTTEDGATVTLYAQWEEDVDEATLISIPVTKLSLEDSSTVLSGVEFSLFELICEDNTHDHTSDDDLIDVNDYDTSCWKLIGTYTSDELGEFTLEDLDITKEYRLVETKTVDGYLVPEGQWILGIAEGEYSMSICTTYAGYGPDMVEVAYTCTNGDGMYLDLCADEDGVYYINGYSEDEITINEIVLSAGDDYTFCVKGLPYSEYTIHVMGYDYGEYVEIANLTDIFYLDGYSYQTDIDVVIYTQEHTVTDDGITDEYYHAWTTTSTETYPAEWNLTVSSVGNPPAVTTGDETLYIYNSTSFDIPTTGAMGIEDYITIGAVIILVGFIGKIHKSKRTVGLRSSRIKVSRAEARNIKKISKMQKRCRKMQKKTEKMLRK